MEKLSNNQVDEKSINQLVKLMENEHRLSFFDYPLTKGFYFMAREIGADIFCERVHQMKLMYL